MDDETVDEVTLWGEYEAPTPSLQLNKEALNNVEYEVIVNSLKNANFKKNFFNSSKETNFVPIKWVYVTFAQNTNTGISYR